MKRIEKDENSLEQQIDEIYNDDDLTRIDNNKNQD